MKISEKAVWQKREREKKNALCLEINLLFISERDTFFNLNFKRITCKVKRVKSWYLKSSITLRKVVPGEEMSSEYPWIHSAGTPINIPHIKYIFFFYLETSILIIKLSRLFSLPTIPNRKVFWRDIIALS